MKNNLSASFEVLTFSPLHLDHAGLGLATVRAGGIAIFNLRQVSESLLPKALNNLDEFLAKASSGARFGFRLSLTQLPTLRPLLDRTSDRHCIVLLTDLALEEELATKLEEEADWLSQPHRTFWADITNVKQLGSFGNLPLVPQVLVAKGRENAGQIGQDAAFVLSQKVLAEAKVPVYIQGGIGVGTAAACRVAGASGVVLEEQLLLMPESPVPHSWRPFLNILRGEETKIEAAGAGEVRVFHARNQPDSFDLQLGQTMALMAGMRDRFRTTGRLIQEIQQQSKDYIESAQGSKALAAGSPMAQFQGTEYPIVQGPMTRVSENAEFALAVAEAGALPMMAVALKSGEETREMVSATRTVMGAHPWGVGILGFLEKELFEAQMAEIHAAKPPFAILSGGNAEQANTMEKLGIQTYLHAPSGKLLTIFLKRGIRKFVFEGEEGGGHIGPTSSFILWEQALETFDRELSPESFRELAVFFAGGIHDEMSAAMVAALAGRLTEKGARVGIVMGTAYLFTEEIRTTKTILPIFQETALECDETALLTYMTGRSIRCVDTPIVEAFNQLRLDGEAEGLSPEEITYNLQMLLRGKLRVASKGLDRNEKGELVQISEDQQYKQGVFMIGQVAGLHDSTCTLAELHETVSAGGSQYLNSHIVGEITQEEEPNPSRIAVVGVSAFLPHALTAEKFWENVIKKDNAITEIPKDRWDWRLFYDPDVKTPDKLVSKWGGFLDELPFDPMKFGIPPHSLKSTSTGQLLTLSAVENLFKDAGIDLTDFDRENTSIILGSEGSSHTKEALTVRATMPMFIKNWAQEDYDRLPEWSEETFAGNLTNVYAGRVANRFDFSGANYAVDSACASSLTAVELGIKELEFGNSNLVIVGGVDLATTPYGFQAFSKSRALSPTGESTPFDAQGNGIVVSEGICLVLLKRLEDAERDGNKIYAVLQGAGLSSDGQGAGLTAPQSKGQQVAFERAYKKAGFSPATLGFYEAHATGTSKGDSVEVTSLNNVLSSHGAGGNSVAVGSAKGLIGHTKTTAGVIGILKGAMSLYYKTLPAQPLKSEPIALLKDQNTPAFVLKDALPWLSPKNYPRRVGVSAFGFGGTNAHVAMEEYAGDYRAVAPGGEHWPYELFRFGCDTKQEMVQQINEVIKGIHTAENISGRELAYVLAQQAERKPEAPFRLSIVADGPEALLKDLDLALRRLKGDDSIKNKPGFSLATQVAQSPGKLAFVFPGQGSQYLNMARENALYIPQMREALEFTNQMITGDNDGLFSATIYPPTAWDENISSQQQQRLTATQNAQPAIGTISMGYLKLLKDLGLEPEMVAGHSYGELTSLLAAGVIDAAGLIQLSQARGQLMNEGCEVDGTMAVVFASEEEVEPHIKGEGVYMANFNSKRQTVISGERNALLEMKEKLEGAGMRVNVLQVAGPFHTHFFNSVQAPLSEAIDATHFQPASAVIYSNTTAEAYPDSPEEMQALLKKHLLSPVRFMQQVEQMHTDGGRTFLEVGPKTVLSGLVKQILDGKEFQAISLESMGGGLRSLLIALGDLYTLGYNPLTSLMVENRLETPWKLNMQKLFAPPAPLPPMTHFIKGNFIRPMNQAKAQWGKVPHITFETKQEANMENQTPNRVTPPSAPQDHTHQNPVQPAVSPQSNWTSQEQQQPVGSTNPHSLQPADVLLEGYRAYQETMQQFLQTQEKVLQSFLNGGQQISPASVPPPVQQVYEQPLPNQQITGSPNQQVTGSPGNQVPNIPPTHLPVPESQTEEPAREEVQLEVANATNESDRQINPEFITQEILTLLSERTGYPTEMIGLDQDLEGELGVDSIKRIEVLDQIIQILPSHWEEQLQAQISNLMRIKSIREIVALIFSETESAEISPVQPALSAIGKKSDGVESAAQVSPAASNGSGHTSQKNAQGLGDQVSKSITSSHIKALPRFVFRPVSLSLPFPRTWSLEGNFLITDDGQGVASQVAYTIESQGGKAFVIDQETLLSREKLELLLEQAWKELKQVRGILHLAPLSDHILPDQLEEWQKISQLHSKSLFQIIRFFGLKHEAGEDTGLTQILGASSFGGQFGRKSRFVNNNSPCLPTAGGFAGTLRSVAKEWEGMQVRVVDFDNDSVVAEVAQCILDEVSFPKGAVDIGYPDGERVSFELKEVIYPQDMEEPPMSMDKDWVVLVIGGAKGITSEITKYFAKPGMKLILAGRSEDFDPDKVVEFSDGSNPSFSDLIASGVEVVYRSVDVRNEGQMETFIQSIYDDYGRLDAVFNGVGVLDDQRFTHKTQESFDMVYDTKVDSAFLLHRFLRPESLKILVFFGSASGSFGNMGQTDYAAANEVVSRYAWYLQKRWRQTRVLTINWGPWASIGMVATSPTITRLIKAQGMTPILPLEGCQYFKEEVENGPQNIAEVVVGEAYWRDIKAKNDNLLELSTLFAEIGKLVERYEPMEN